MKATTIVLLLSTIAVGLVHSRPMEASSAPPPHLAPPTTKEMQSSSAAALAGTGSENTKNGLSAQGLPILPDVSSILTSDGPTNKPWSSITVSYGNRGPYGFAYDKCISTVWEGIAIKSILVTVPATCLVSCL